MPLVYLKENVAKRVQTVYYGQCHFHTKAEFITFYYPCLSCCRIWNISV